ncbi:MAG TPA: ABC transporter permease [Thermoplasmata archaeon]|nr:ABC transporter permease [Thermoplasmata archaeon]
MALARPRWTGTGAFTLTEFRVQLHEGLAIVTSMIVQVVLLIFVDILDRPILPYALIGAVVYSLFMLGQRVQNEAAYIRIDHKLTELYHASPLTAEGYFVGMSAGVLLAYLPPILVLVVAMELIAPLGPLASATLLGAGAAVWLFTSSMGYVFSTLFKENRAIWPYASILTNLFGVLPPVFYPIRFLPGYWHPIALAIPTSSAAALVEAAQGGLVSLSGGELLFGAIVLAIEAIAVFVFAVYWARRSARER